MQRTLRLNDIVCTGDVHLVDFEPAVGTEIQKARPAVVISPDAFHLHFGFQTMLVVPLKSYRPERNLGVEGFVLPPEGGLDWPSIVVASQLRVIDRQRIIHPIGQVSDGSLSRIKGAVARVFDFGG